MKNSFISLNPAQQSLLGVNNHHLGQVLRISPSPAGAALGFAPSEKKEQYDTSMLVGKGMSAQAGLERSSQPNWWSSEYDEKFVLCGVSPVLEEIGFKLWTVPDEPYLLKIESMEQILELDAADAVKVRVLPMDDTKQSLESGMNTTHDLHFLEPETQSVVIFPDLSKIFAASVLRADGSGVVVRWVDREFEITPCYRKVLVPEFESAETLKPDTTMLEHWILQLGDDPWLQEELETYLKVGDLWHVSAAVGLYARFRRVPKQRRQDVVEALLRGERDSEEEAPWQWIHDLRQAQISWLQDIAQEKIFGICDKMERLEDTLNPDDPMWQAELRELLYERDDLESIVFLLHERNDATSIQLLLPVVDELGPCFVTAMPHLAELQEDERIHRICSSMPHVWWASL